MNKDTIKIIPAIDIIDGHIVRLSRGDYDRKTVYGEAPYEVARKYVDAGFTHIHVVDLDGAKASAPANLAELEKMASIPGIEVEWGGGIKSEASLQSVIDAGATYAVIGSVAAGNPPLFIDWLRQYGAERMILGADVLYGIVKVNGWLEGAGVTIEELLRLFIPHDLRRVICTDISRDGMLQGPSYELYSGLKRDFPGLEITVSGGISSMADIEKLNDMGLDSVIVGKALYEGCISLDELSKFIVC